MCNVQCVVCYLCRDIWTVSNWIWLWRAAEQEDFWPCYETDNAYCCNLQSCIAVRVATNCTVFGTKDFFSDIPGRFLWLRKILIFLLEPETGNPGCGWDWMRRLGNLCTASTWNIDEAGGTERVSCSNQGHQPAAAGCRVRVRTDHCGESGRDELLRGRWWWENVPVVATAGNQDPAALLAAWSRRPSPSLPPPVSPSSSLPHCAAAQAQLDIY